MSSCFYSYKPRVSESVTMFVAVVLALFAYGICKNEIVCSTIRPGSFNAEKKDSTKLTENLTLLKSHSQSMTPAQAINKKTIISTNKKKSQDSADTLTSPLIENGKRILISTRKDRRSKDTSQRQPKFFGPLGFLANLGAGGLTTIISDNFNPFAKLWNGAFPLVFVPSRYITGFYETPQYLPFPYSGLHPVLSPAHQQKNSVSGIPVIPPPPLLPQRIVNATAGDNLNKSDTNFGRNEEADKQPIIEKVQESEETAATKVDSKRTIAPDDVRMNDDVLEDIDSASVISEEEPESRLSSGTTPKPKTTTSKPNATTTKRPTTMNTTKASNDTVPTMLPVNTTESKPFYGYYGGSPQEVGQVIFTTEDPKTRYLKDYIANVYPLPFERQAVFNPYQNVESSYPNPFVNSFSSGEPYPEYLNTIESDRYLYDSDNHQNLNGFRPILK